MNELTELNFLDNKEAENDVDIVEGMSSIKKVPSNDLPIGSTTKETTAATDENVTKEVTVKNEAGDEVKESDKMNLKIDKLDKILEAQQLLLENIKSLNDLFNMRIMHTDHEEKIVDYMHKELQKYKEDLYAQLVRPILLDVIEVRDSIMRIAEAYLSKPEGEQNIPNKTFSDYAFDLQDILEKNSVEIYRSKSGDTFTPIKQRIIKKVATSDVALHGKIAESLSCGYSYNGRTISPEKVNVYYFEK